MNAHFQDAVRELVCDRRIDHLPDLLRFVHRACEEAGVDDEVDLAVQLAVEEVCTMIIRLGPPGREPGSIRLCVRTTPERVEVTISVGGLPRASAEMRLAAVTSGPRDDEAGFNWPEVRAAMDEIHYYEGPEGGNHLRLVKRRSGF